MSNCHIDLFFTLHCKQTADSFLSVFAVAEKLILCIRLHIAAYNSNVGHTTNKRINHCFPNLSTERISNFALNFFVILWINAAASGRCRHFVNNSVKQFFYADVLKCRADKYRKDFCVTNTGYKTVHDFFIC